MNDIEFSFFKLKTWRNNKGELWITEKQFRWHFREVLRMCEKEPVFISSSVPGSDCVLMSVERYEQLTASTIKR